MNDCDVFGLPGIRSSEDALLLYCKRYSTLYLVKSILTIPEDRFNFLLICAELRRLADNSHIAQPCPRAPKPLRESRP